VELHRDDITGKSKGYAFILFRNAHEAKKAIAEMNNFMINGKQIKVLTSGFNNI
jgi:RNA-binding protein 39